ncbi:Rhs element Vgr protein [Burkholderia ubonensis]|uniref:Rhs element Vgr protein n=1 Tax=Burkholderia ubonensis TaxID=101571 RepID=A0A119ESF1_9BURK|nr:phage baseplate assembly protein V [Burkholderia ubonensis]KVH81822.1 Rhs element Vgr protein [Burkholderia ubonensis]KVM16994.1 Rhs element Vgr protein [Burkholderia ubonensis]KVM18818.1 Rhs element Vgr protein [Burkholderia ubonensis]KVM42246.1 Rhs element Vgr protein [Burkholderia ubonensis]KVN85804.1 Rhs element Vgr protein [Burkholderia ubonensis]
MNPAEALSLDSLALGVTPGAVSNTQDPQGLGRIKVTFILKGAQIESDWLQVVSFFAGPACGAFFLPQVGDSALLAFANGDASRAYVLGFLWNGAQKPPVGQAAQQDVRVITTKYGKSITLDDSGDGKGRIVITDDQQNRIQIDTAGNRISISSEGDLDISAKGKLTIRGEQVTVQNASGSVKAEFAAAALQVQGDQNLKLSATMIDLN